jgi:hypothetical protein
MKVAYGGIYTIAALTGVVTLLVPPNTIQGEIGPVLTLLWSALFILGGLGGMCTVLPGWWKWERWSLAFCLVGIGIYAFVITALHFTSSGSRLTQLGVLLLAASTFIIRWLLIRGYSFEPRR